MNAYAVHQRLHLGDRRQLLHRMLDAWWAAREDGEAVMQASTWHDVLELNELARERLVESGLVHREGLDVRGVTVGVGDVVMVLRNAPAHGVINGTMGRVTAIERQRGDIVLRTIEPEPREVHLPASFWKAKGRRRVALAYCRTIHKAQGSTYRGSSFTLAGDDTIHLEAVHVALSRATTANHLYYMGEPPPDEDHHSVEVTEARFEGLVAAAARSRPQVMALDVLEGVAAPALPTGTGSAVALSEAPMTDAQIGVLARHGVAPGGARTWVQASLLIDQAKGSPIGRQARSWLVENGASADEATEIVERVQHELEAPRLRQAERRRAWARRPQVGESADGGALRRSAQDAANVRFTRPAARRHQPRSGR
jgi:hypothetical protein